jgi:mycofactocin system creatininase family protein
VRDVSDPTTRHLGEATWTALDSASERPILLVPIGSCEQHGPHLPLDTDTRVALAIAEAVAERTTGLIVAPALGVSASGEHHGFPGTLSIGSAATEMMLIELARSADWSGGLVLINGHGGNHAAVQSAVDALTYEGRRVLSWWPAVPNGDAHAGRTETSLMLSIAPHLVRIEAVEPGNTTPLRELLPRLEHGGVRSVSSNGVLGDPTGASAAEGAELLEALVGDATERIAAWRASLDR